MHDIACTRQSLSTEQLLYELQANYEQKQQQQTKRRKIMTQNDTTQKLEAKVITEHTIRTSAGKEIPAITLQGWTGSPDFYEFNAEQARFTCHILTNSPDEGTESHRVNFWGKLAYAAYAALLANESGPRVAFLRIQGTVSSYLDRNNIGKSSININYERQYQVLKSKQYAPVGQGFLDMVEQTPAPGSVDNNPQPPQFSEADTDIEAPF